MLPDFSPAGALSRRSLSNRCIIALESNMQEEEEEETPLGRRRSSSNSLLAEDQDRIAVLEKAEKINITTGTSKLAPVGRYVGILSVMFLFIVSLVSVLFRTRVLRLKTTRTVSIICRGLSLPWIGNTPNKTLPECEQKKMVILEKFYDMHLLNGVPEPDAFVKSVEIFLKGKANISNATPIEIVHCATCAPSGGDTWIVALSNGSISLSAALKGSLNHSALIRFTGMWYGARMWNSIDIGVPFGCQDLQQLLYFAALLSESIKNIRLDISVRLLITNHSCTRKWERPTLEELDKLAGLKKRRSLKAAANKTGSDRVIIFPISEPFSDMRARSILHANTDHEHQESLLIVVDVQFCVHTRFIHNAMTLVSVGASAYFPVTRLAFCPRHVKGVFAFREAPEPRYFHKDKGLWRMAGFDVYAMAGPDAAQISMELDSDFTGWGNEGHEFITNKVLKHVHIVRKMESGLIRMWYPSVSEGDAVERHVVRREAHAEASPLAMFIQVNSQRFPNRRIIEHPAQIMIAVITSRTEFQRRASALEAIWARKSQLPPAVVVRYFVGQQNNTFISSIEGRKNNMKRELAFLLDGRVGQSFNPDESIVILDDVEDQDHVGKKRAMLPAIVELVTSRSEINWIVLIDDDTYLHVAGLQRLLAKHDKDRPVLLGPMRRDQEQRQPDSEIVSAAYCMGGPTYAMSHVMLEEGMREREKCILKADVLRPKKLHAGFWLGTVTDMCNERAVLTSGGCQEEITSYQDKTQAIADRRQVEDFVSVHPLSKIWDFEAASGRRRVGSFDTFGLF